MFFFANFNWLEYFHIIGIEYVPAWVEEQFIKEYSIFENENSTEDISI